MTRIIPLLDYFIFAGKSSLEFRVRISGNGTYKTAERVTETVIVPGRNGDLTIDDKRFGTVDYVYEAYIVDNFDENYSGLINYLLSKKGNHRLEDSYHLDEFRMAKFNGPIEPNVLMAEAGSFDISFRVQPQRFLKSGEREITLSAGTFKVKNPTLMTALPKITVTSGTGDLVIGSQHAVLSANNGNTVIDSELQDCYEGTTNRNPDLALSDGFPALGEGFTEITVPAGMTVKLQPRWWKL